MCFHFHFLYFFVSFLSPSETRHAAVLFPAGEIDRNGVLCPLQSDGFANVFTTCMLSPASSSSSSPLQPSLLAHFFVGGSEWMDMYWDIDIHPLTLDLFTLFCLCFCGAVSSSYICARMLVCWLTTKLSIACVCLGQSLSVSVCQHSDMDERFLCSPYFRVIRRRKRQRILCVLCWNPFSGRIGPL